MPFFNPCAYKYASYAAFTSALMRIIHDCKSVKLNFLLDFHLSAENCLQLMPILHSLSPLSGAPKRTHLYKRQLRKNVCIVAVEAQLSRTKSRVGILQTYCACNSRSSLSAIDAIAFPSTEGNKSNRSQKK